MSYGDTIVQISILIVIIFVTVAAAHYIVDEHFYDATPAIGLTDNFTYMPHYVKFHIYPEEGGVWVALWASDNLPPTTAATDNNSEIVLPLISSVKYNLWIPERNFSAYIYPNNDMYYINTRVK